MIIEVQQCELDHNHVNIDKHVVQNFDDIDFTHHPDICLVYDDCKIHFAINIDGCCSNLLCNFSKTQSLQTIIDKIRYEPPVDKSLYNVDVLLNKNKYDKYTQHKISLHGFDEEAIAMQVAIRANNLTDEMKVKCNELLHENYVLQLHESKRQLKLINSFMNTFNDLSEEVYNIAWFQHVQYSNYDVFPMCIYIEKYCDAWYFFQNEEEVHFMTPDNDRDYGYGLNDLFEKQPCTVEIDNVEYVMYDIRMFFRNKELIRVFSKGKILSVVFHEELQE